MNQSQVKYAKERALKIYNAKAKAVTEKHTTPAVTMTNGEKIEALLSGDFVINRSIPSTFWYNYVVFKTTPAKVDTAARDAELALLNKKFEQIMDELILGDNEQALAMLKELESF